MSEIGIKRDIVLPDTKPALEWINGRAVQKVSPKRKHALAQIQFATALNLWAGESGAGMVGTEWHFHVAYASLPYAAQLETDIPRVPPDVAIEIISPNDRPTDVTEKVRVYLAAGARAVVLVDTDTQIVTVFEMGHRRQLGRNDVFEHESLPGFRMAVESLFTPPQPPR